MMTSFETHSILAGVGGFLPPHPVSNADLVARLAQQGIETSDAWIVERTGIQNRHFAPDDMTTSQMGTVAAKQALAHAGLTAESVDLIVVATSTPDMVFPSTAALIQHQLGIKGCPAFDVQAVCTGFVYAMGVADAMIRTGMARCALVIGAEAFSRIIDFQDRGTCVLFGDGAGAVVLQASERPGILGVDLHADGSLSHILNVPGQVRQGAIWGDPLLRMDGQAVFRQAIGVLGRSAQTLLTKTKTDIHQIDWLIPHQANIRIMQGLANKMNLPMEKVVVTVDQHGNTSAASIPLALNHLVQSQRLQRGQTLMLQGVGGGFTWGSLLVIY